MLAPWGYSLAEMTKAMLLLGLEVGRAPCHTTTTRYVLRGSYFMHCWSHRFTVALVHAPGGFRSPVAGVVLQDHSTAGAGERPEHLCREQAKWSACMHLTQFTELTACRYVLSSLV